MELCWTFPTNDTTSFGSWHNVVLFWQFSLQVWDGVGVFLTVFVVMVVVVIVPPIVVAVVVVIVGFGFPCRASLFPLSCNAVPFWSFWTTTIGTLDHHRVCSAIELLNNGLTHSFCSVGLVFWSYRFRLRIFLKKIVLRTTATTTLSPNVG